MQEPGLIHKAVDQGRGKLGTQVIGVGNQCDEIPMLAIADGPSQPERSRFITPPIAIDQRKFLANACSYLWLCSSYTKPMTGCWLYKRSAELVGLVVPYEDVCQLCYNRNPEELLIGLVEKFEKE